MKYFKIKLRKQSHYNSIKRHLSINKWSFLVAQQVKVPALSLL